MAHLHRYLIDAAEDRNTSDYLADDEPPADTAELHIQHAEEFIAPADQMLSVSE